MNYGIEFEFFVLNKEQKMIPAYKATRKLDGNPIIGELRTSVHDNIVDCVFELKKLIFLEQDNLDAQGFIMSSMSEAKVDDKFLKEIRSDEYYINRKQLEVLKELSIYNNGKTGKILPRGCYKSSLQINFSKNPSFSYTKYEKITIEDKSRIDTKRMDEHYSALFDYIAPIIALDKAFATEITDSKRIKGVYAIKNGDKGDRIEYRSLPSTVELNKIISVLK